MCSLHHSINTGATTEVTERKGELVVLTLKCKIDNGFYDCLSQQAMQTGIYLISDLSVIPNL